VARSPAYLSPYQNAVGTKHNARHGSVSENSDFVSSSRLIHAQLELKAASILRPNKNTWDAKAADLLFSTMIATGNFTATAAGRA
jgi:hypothetical protein